MTKTSAVEYHLLWYTNMAQSHMLLTYIEGTQFMEKQFQKMFNSSEK